jgi:hypothetical protein
MCVYNVPKHMQMADFLHLQSLLSRNTMEFTARKFPQQCMFGCRHNLQSFKTYAAFKQSLPVLAGKMNGSHLKPQADH